MQQGAGADAIERALGEAGGFRPVILDPEEARQKLRTGKIAVVVIPGDTGWTYWQDPTRPARVDPKNIIEAVLRHGVTNMFASPALLNRVGRYGRDNRIKLPSLRRVISAGAPALPSILECFSTMLNKETEIFPGYGATEAMPVAAIGSHTVLSETRQLSEKGFGICVGRVVHGVKARVIRISDDEIPEWSEDLCLSEGEIGEIAVQGELVTRSYFHRPKDDNLGKIRDGGLFWHRMGDLGWFDKEARLWFCGRKSHRVIMENETLFTYVFAAGLMEHRNGNGVTPDAVKHAVAEVFKRVKGAYSVVSGGSYGKVSHLVGNHGKPRPRFTSPGRLHRRVQRKQICLECNLIDGFYNLGCFFAGL